MVVRFVNMTKSEVNVKNVEEAVFVSTTKTEAIVKNAAEVKSVSITNINTLVLIATASGYVNQDKNHTTQVAEQTATEN